MATPIKMPKLGMTMSEGTVVEWPVALGRFVAKGEVVLRIESEKAEVEIEATAAGCLRHVYVEPGTTVPCGTLLAALTDAADDAFDAEAFRREHDTPAVRAVPPAAVVPGAGSGVSGVPPRAAGRKPVAPAARALARTLGVDVAAISGTGPGGRVTRADVEAWAAAQAALVEVAAGVRLEVPTSGAGDDVLLLPGFGTDAAVFARQAALLAAGHRVRGVNPRGVGLSDAPELPSYPLARAAADVAALVERPAHVVGASMGAAIAIELALVHPECVRTLTLLTPVVEVSARLAAMLDGWCRVAATASAETVAAMLLPWMFADVTLAEPRARDRLRRGLAAMVARVPAAVLQRYAAGLEAWSGSRVGDLPRIGVPTLVLGGGADLVTSDAGRVAGAIPGARLLMVAGAGHALSLEAADQIDEALRLHLGAASGGGG